MVFLFKNIFISILLSYVDTTSFEDISPQGISDDSSTGSRVHGKIWTLLREYIFHTEWECWGSGTDLANVALPASMFSLTCIS